MRDPKIVFCPNNHIYDESIYSECPYCRKIAEDQSALSKSLGDIGISIDDSIDREDDSTELLHNNPDEEDSESTELIRRDKEKEDFLGQEEETELLQNTNMSDTQNETKNVRACEASNLVLGWLVSIGGSSKGRSYEISEGTTYIYKTVNGFEITRQGDSKKFELARIQRDIESRLFKINPSDGVAFKVNGRNFSESWVHSYDTIACDEYMFLFVELITAFVEWGAD